MSRVKMEITESTVLPLHFIDVYIPLDKEEWPEVVVESNNKRMHIFISSQGRPYIKIKGEPTYEKYFDKRIFGEYDFLYFWELCQKLEDTTK